MGKGFIRFCHSVRIIFLLDRGPLIVEAIGQLGSKPLFHRAARFGAGDADDPAHRHRGASVGRNLDRHLVGGAADTARFHFERRLCIFERLLKGLHGIFRFHLFGKFVQGIVDDAAGSRFFAGNHHFVDKFG